MSEQLQTPFYHLLSTTPGTCCRMISLEADLEADVEFVAQDVWYQYL